MLMKRCPRCGKMMPYGPTYCVACKPLAAAELAVVQEENARKKARIYNKKRDSKYLTFYRSKEWRTLSRSFLQAAGYKCQAHLTTDCKVIATEVHHVEPIQTPNGWERRLDWENLEAVCTACHNGRHPEKLRKAEPGVIDLKTIQR